MATRMAGAQPDDGQEGVRHTQPLVDQAQVGEEADQELTGGGFRCSGMHKGWVDAHWEPVDGSQPLLCILDEADLTACTTSPCKLVDSAEQLMK